MAGCMCHMINHLANLIEDALCYNSLLYYPVKPCIKEFFSVISDITNQSIYQPYLLISPRKISRYHLRKNQRKKLLMTKEPLIGEHNLKPLLTVHKESIDW